MKEKSVLLLTFSLFVTLNVFSQPETFSQTVKGYLDSLNVPYKFTPETNLFEVTFCEGLECAKIFIGQAGFSEKENTLTLEMATGLMVTDAAHISKSLLGRVNDCNYDCKMGKVIFINSNDMIIISYKNEMWLNDMNLNSFYKNLALCLVYGQKYKKELQIFAQ